MSARINVDHLPNVLRLCPHAAEPAHQWRNRFLVAMTDERNGFGGVENLQFLALGLFVAYCVSMEDVGVGQIDQVFQRRSEEHTSELQSLMRISYAVFCLKKKKHKQYTIHH